MFNAILGSCGLKMASKTAGRGVKRNEIWESWVVATCTWVTFDFLVFKVSLGSFGALVSKWPASGKRLAVERNDVNFGTRG